MIVTDDDCDCQVGEWAVFAIFDPEGGIFEV